MPTFGKRAFPIAIILTLGGAGFGVFHSLNVDNDGHGFQTPLTQETETQYPIPESNPAPILHIPLPAEVRGMYWTAVTAGGARGDELLSYMKDTGLNSVVIDLKMDDGAIAFVPKDETLNAYALDEPVIRDLESVLKKLADYDIYRIARLAVMRDGVFAEAHRDIALQTKNGNLWQDKIGSKWMDPAATSVRDYAITLAKEAYERGFDEVQFDYIRFPSDGSIGSIVYPVWGPTTSTMIDVMQDFFGTIGDAMDEAGIPISFDLFGMPFLSISDFNIGQRLPDAYPYADFLSPMVYPSHYPANFHGMENPALYPYEVIKQTLDSGAEIMENIYGVPQDESRKKFRPWIQDFDIGAVYTAERIEAQIEATRAASSSGFLIWNARNVYERADYVSSTH